jgi:ubiquitin carboxyl-terminal hydrolase 10
VHSPPFRILFKELGDLKGRRVAGVSGTGGGATPLVDATMRFFEESVFEEKEPAQRLPERAARGDFEEKRKDVKVVGAFEPMYLYDAMKEKSQLKDLLVRSRDEDAPFCY